MGSLQLQVEEMMRDITQADSEWRTIVLRYFNPVGAHPSGRLGEDPQGFPNNLMPFVQQVAVGRRKELTVFGSDYNTKDGTGVSFFLLPLLQSLNSLVILQNSQEVVYTLDLIIEYGFCRFVITFTCRTLQLVTVPPFTSCSRRLI